jgi:hypothetical protein
LPSMRDPGKPRELQQRSLTKANEVFEVRRWHSSASKNPAIEIGFVAPQILPSIRIVPR